MIEFAHFLGQFFCADLIIKRCFYIVYCGFKIINCILQCLFVALVVSKLCIDRYILGDRIGEIKCGSEIRIGIPANEDIALNYGGSKRSLLSTLKHDRHIIHPIDTVIDGNLAGGNDFYVLATVSRAFGGVYSNGSRCILSCINDNGAVDGDAELGTDTIAILIGGDNLERASVQDDSTGSNARAIRARCGSSYRAAGNGNVTILCINDVITTCGSVDCATGDRDISRGIDARIAADNIDAAEAANAQRTVYVKGYAALNGIDSHQFDVDVRVGNNSGSAGDTTDRCIIQRQGIGFGVIAYLAVAQHVVLVGIGYLNSIDHQIIENRPLGVIGLVTGLGRTDDGNHRAAEALVIVPTFKDISVLCHVGRKCCACAVCI